MFKKANRIDSICTTDSQDKKYLSFFQILSYPPKKWIFNNWFGEGDVGVIYGEDGSDKTLILIDLMFSVALGKKFAGQFLPNEKTKCLYVSNANFYGTIDKIKTRASLEKLLDNFDEYFWIQKGFLSLSNERETKDFIEYYKDAKLGLIVIELESVDISLILAAKLISHKLNCVVVLTHSDEQLENKELFDFIIKLENVQNGRKFNFKSDNQCNSIGFNLQEIKKLDGEKGVVIEWEEIKNKPESKNNIIRMFLFQNADKWFTYEMIVEGLNNNQLLINTVRFECNELLQNGILIKSDDKDLKKKLGVKANQTVVKYNNNN